MVIKQAARARISMRICKIGAVFLWRIFFNGSQPDLAKHGAPKSKKTIFEIDEIPNLLDPLIYFIRIYFYREQTAHV